MEIITVWAQSPAFEELRKAIESPDTYKVSISLDGGQRPKIKINEGVWSPPLRPQLRDEELAERQR